MSVRPSRRPPAAVMIGAAASIVVHALLLAALLPPHPAVGVKPADGPVVFLSSRPAGGGAGALPAPARRSVPRSPSARARERTDTPAIRDVRQPAQNSADDTTVDGAAGRTAGGGLGGGIGDPLLRSVRGRFIALLAGRKTYPARAREKGIEGNVALFVRLNPSGSAERVEVRRSSGSPLLDSAAVDLVRRALPFRHGLGTGIAMEFTIAYRITD